MQHSIFSLQHNENNVIKKIWQAFKIHLLIFLSMYSLQ